MIPFLESRGPGHAMPIPTILLLLSMILDICLESELKNSLIVGKFDVNSFLLLWMTFRFSSNNEEEYVVPPISTPIIY